MTARGVLATPPPRQMSCQWGATPTSSRSVHQMSYWWGLPLLVPGLSTRCHTSSRSVHQMSYQLGATPCPVPCMVGEAIPCPVPCLVGLPPVWSLVWWGGNPCPVPCPMWGLPPRSKRHPPPCGQTEILKTLPSLTLRVWAVKMFPLTRNVFVGECQWVHVRK